MDVDRYFHDHWVTIERERFERYDQMFRLDPARAATLLAPVGVEAGHVVVDLGCGPGYVAAELAKLVGPDGLVHAVDVNADFVRRTQEVAREAGVAGRVVAHHVAAGPLPLHAATADRAYAKNVLEYVPDLAETLGELLRVLRPGGRLCASDSDWGFVVVEPLHPDEVRELFDAAAPAFREPYVGRKLRAAMLEVGFVDVGVDVRAVVDTQGWLRGVLENMLGYAGRFGTMGDARAGEVRSRIDEALASGDYMMVLPQFTVTGTRP